MRSAQNRSIWVRIASLVLVLALLPFSAIGEPADATDPEITKAYNDMMNALSLLEGANEALAKADTDAAAALTAKEDAQKAVDQAQAAVDAAKAAMDAAGVTEDGDIAKEIEALTARKTELQLKITGAPVAKQAEITANNLLIEGQKVAVSNQEKKVTQANNAVTEQEKLIGETEAEVAVWKGKIKTATDEQKNLNNQNVIDNNAITNNTAQKTAAEKAAADATTALDNLDQNIEELTKAANDAANAETKYLEKKNELLEKQADLADAKKLMEDAEKNSNDKAAALEEASKNLEQMQKDLEAEEQTLQTAIENAETAYANAQKEAEEQQNKLDEYEKYLDNAVTKAAYNWAVEQSAGYATKIEGYNAQIDALELEKAGVPAAITAKEGEIAELNGEIAETNAAISEKNSDIAENTAAYNAQVAAVATAQKNYDDAVKEFEADPQVANLNTLISNLNAEIATLDTVIADAEARAKELQETLIPNAEAAVEAKKGEIDGYDNDLNKRGFINKGLIQKREEAYTAWQIAVETGKLVDWAYKTYQDALAAEQAVLDKKAAAEKALGTEAGAEEGTLYGNLANLNNELTTQTSTISNKSALKQEKSDKVTELTNELTEYTSTQNSAITDLNNILTAAKNELTRLENEGKQLTADLKTLVEVTLPNQQATLVTKTNELTALQNRPAQIDGEIADLNDKIESAENWKSGFDTTIREYEEILNNINAQREAAKNSAKDEEQALADLNEAKAALQGRKDAITAQQTEVNNAKTAAENEAKNFTEKKAEFEKQEADVQLKLEEVNALLENGNPEELQAKAQADLEKALETYDADKAALEQSITTNTNEANRLAGVIENLGKEIANRNVRLSEIEGELETYSAKKSELEAKLGTEAGAEEGTQYGELAKRKAAAATAQTKLAEEQTKLANLNATKTRLEAELADIDNSADVLAWKAEIADIDEQIASFDGEAKLLADYKDAQTALAAAKTKFDAAKLTYDGAAALQKACGLAQVAAKIVYDEAYSKYMQLTGSTNCAHDDFKVEIFGQTFCPLKAISLCTHNAGSCCTNLDVNQLAADVKATLEAGDFETLANEVKSLFEQTKRVVAAYEELPEGIRDAIEATVKSIVKKAINEVGAKLLGEEKWAQFADLAEKLMDPEEVQKLMDQVKANMIAKLKGEIEAAIGAEKFDKIEPAIDVTLEKLEEIVKEYDLFNMTAEDVKNIAKETLAQYKEQLIAQFKADILDAIGNDSYEKIEPILNAAIAKIDEINNKYDLFDLTKEDLENIAKDVMNDVKAKLIEDVKAAVKKAMETDEYQQIKPVVDAVLAKIEEIKQEYGGLDLSKEDIENIVEDLARELLAKLQAEIEQKIADAAGVESFEEIVAAVKKAIATINEIKNQIPDESEIKEALTAFVNKMAAKLKEKILAELKAAIDAAIEKSCYDEVIAAIEAAKAKLEALKEMIPDCEDIVNAIKEISANAAAKIKAAIEAKIEYIMEHCSPEQIKAELAALLEKIEALKEKLDDFGMTAEEIKAIIKNCITKIADKAKADIKAAVEALMDSEAYAYVAEKAEALIAYVEAKLAELHLCEDNVDVIIADIEARMAEFVEDVNAYLEEKVDGLTCESVLAKLESICDATKELLQWIPEADLTVEDVKEIIAAATASAKEIVIETVNKIEDYIIAMGKHNLIIDEAVEPTCYTTGLTEGSHCACGHVFTAQQIIEATGEHVYDEGVVTTEPTATEEGVMTFTCTTEGCGDSYTESIPAIGPERVPGDANDSGDFSIVDMQLVMKRLSGMGVTINEVNADVDASNTVTIADLQLMMKKLSGWDVVLQ